jgi:hypothetical protein
MLPVCSRSRINYFIRRVARKRGQLRGLRPEIDAPLGLIKAFRPSRAGLRKWRKDWAWSERPAKKANDMTPKELIEMIESGRPDGDRLVVKRATISMPWGLYRDAPEAILAPGFRST